jgi:hypothetical protein
LKQKNIFLKMLIIFDKKLFLLSLALKTESLGILC